MRSGAITALELLESGRYSKGVWAALFFTQLLLANTAQLGEGHEMQGLRWQSERLSDAKDGLPGGTFVVMSGTYERSGWKLAPRLSMSVGANDRVVLGTSGEFKVYLENTQSTVTFGLAAISDQGKIDQKTFTFQVPNGKRKDRKLDCEVPAEFLLDPTKFAGPPASLASYCESESVALKDLSVAAEPRVLSQNSFQYVPIAGSFTRKNWKLFTQGQEVLINEKGEFQLVVGATDPITILEFTAVGPKKEKQIRRFILYVPKAADHSREIDALTQPAWRFPAISTGSPTGYGASAGDLSFGIFYNPVDRLQKYHHTQGLGSGALGASFGLGDADKAVALETSVAVTELYENDPRNLHELVTTLPNFNTGGVSFKLHHSFDESWALSLGREMMIRWGHREHLVPAWYLAGTKPFFIRQPNEWFSAIVVNGGFGTGRFLSQSKIDNEEFGVNLFASLALRIHQPVTLIVDWQGNTLDMALSATPFRKFGMYVTAGLTDLAGSLSDGTRPFVSLGFAFSLL